jgi:hypothetical protein
MKPIYVPIYSCLLLIPLFIAGCAAPKRTFVLGLYDVPLESLHEVKEAGFDVVTNPSGRLESGFLNSAHKENLRVLVHSSAFWGNRTKTDKEIREFDKHPATWGWYLIDEPDLHDIPPRRVATITQEFQRRTQKPGIVVLASGSAARLYGADCDLLFVDFYPVAWTPVSRFAKEMLLASLVRADKPYIAVVQAFDWSHFPDVLGQSDGLRTPTGAEVRCMAYMALALEARGLFFYSYQTQTWKLKESSLWPALKSLAKDLRDTSQIFENPPLWWPTEVAYHNVEKQYNEVHEGRILSRLYHVKKGDLRFPSGYYFVVINTTAEDVGFDFRLPFADVNTVLIGENVSRTEDGWLRQTYKPYEVAIVGPIQAAPTFQN